MKIQRIFVIAFIIASGIVAGKSVTISQRSSRTAIQSKSGMIQKQKMVEMFKKEVNRRYGFRISNTKFSRPLVYWMRAIL